MNVENKLAMIKQSKKRRHRNPHDAIAEDDPTWGQWRPDQYKSDEAKADKTMHPEIRKMLYSDLPEGPGYFEINNEQDANIYEGF